MYTPLHAEKSVAISLRSLPNATELYVGVTPPGAMPATPAMGFCTRMSQRDRFPSELTQG